MFSPKTFNTSRPNFSPFTPGKGVGSTGKQRSTNKVILSQRKTSFTPSRRETTGNWSFATDDTTTLQRLELYGGALPVLLTEALTLCTRASDLSVKLDPSGWAWLVWDRKLLLWKYKAAPFGKGSLCKELTLPPTEGTHSAELITVLTYPHDVNNVACVAVSPEGVIRYWSTVAHEGSYVEVSADIKAFKGAECVSVIALQTFSCILATSNSVLLHLTPAPNELRCRVLKAPQGIMSGIGRRMSSLIFGSGTTQTIEAPFYRMVGGEMLDGQTQAFYVLTGSHMQKWALQGEYEKMLYQCPVEKLFADCISSVVWSQDSSNLPCLRVWLIDLQVARDGVVLLGAAMNPDVDNLVHYALGTLHTEGVDSPQSFISFTTPKVKESYTEELPLPGYRLLIPDPAAISAYLQDSHSISCVSVNSSTQPVDRVDFHSPGDRLLGSGSCDDMALFFSVAHGLVTMKGTGLGSAPPNASVNESIAEHTISKMDLTSTEEPSKGSDVPLADDNIQRLKSAFIQSCRKNMNEAQAIVDDLFPADIPPGDSSLDTIVAELSREMVDDYPASDPRWAESVPNSGCLGTSSLILQHQLDDKLKAHDVYINFLKSVNLWDKLTMLPVRETPMLTRMLLCEHAEKLVAAKVLREFHNQHHPLLEQTIKQVLEDRGESTPTSGLTPQDVFYREVSKVHEILPSLQDYEEQMLQGELNPRELVSLVIACNKIIVGMVHEACHYRLLKAALYQGKPRAHVPEYIPWTASTGLKGIRSVLITQHELTLKEALQEAKDVQERGNLYQQLLEITDKVLDGYSTQLESIKHSGGGDTAHYDEVLKQHEQHRTTLIMPFLKEQQYERAASLAEKYCDFAVLVELCEMTSNQERLQRYMNQFHARGFSDFVFRWYVDMGQRGKLMASTLASHPQLARFLQSGENKYMSWLHDINNADFYQAHRTLQDLALGEQQFLNKKKTLLSLSKLCALASDDPPDDMHSNFDHINEELDLITNQEQLPVEVLEAMGEDPENMRVLSPKELIEQYVGGDNIHSNEFDFKKALDLLQYVGKSDRELEHESLKLYIWCKAIDKDDWTNINTEDPLEGSKETIFFKTVELAYSEGMDLRGHLPNVKELLSSDGLGTLKDDKNFQYLVKAMYEQIDRILQ